MIELGDRAKCKITGFMGIVVGKSQWINGCTTTGIKSEVLKDGITLDIQWFDDPQIEMVDKNVVPCGKDPGGPARIPKSTMSTPK